MSGQIQSQDVFLNATNTVSVVASGGGGSVPENLVVSTLSALALTNISSVNGTPYGGGGGPVPANLVVSTLTAANGISTLGGLSIGGDARLVADYKINWGFSSFITALNATNLRLSSEFGSIQLYSPSTIMSNTNGPTQVAINGNLNVSSINGANPADDPVRLGGYNINIGAFSTTQGQFFPNDNSNRLFSMSTIAGHTYRLDVNTRITPAQPSVTPSSIPPNNSFIIYVFNSANTLYTDSIPAQDVYNIARGPLSSFNASYSIPFLAAGAYAQAYIAYAVDNSPGALFVYTNATNVSSLGSALLTDLGVL